MVSLWSKVKAYARIVLNKNPCAISVNGSEEEEDSKKEKDEIEEDNNSFLGQELKEQYQDSARNPNDESEDENSCFTKFLEYILYHV